VTNGSFYWQMFDKICVSVLGEQSLLIRILRMDFNKYVTILADWGFDLLFVQKILYYIQQFTQILSANIFFVIGLVISFSSWIINLGFDFMVFLFCLFYLLLDSDSITSQIKKLVQFVPNPNQDQNNTNTNTPNPIPNLNLNTPDFNSNNLSPMRQNSISSEYNQNIVLNEFQDNNNNNTFLTPNQNHKNPSNDDLHKTKRGTSAEHHFINSLFKF
jgi:hypothetical protein